MFMQRMASMAARRKAPDIASSPMVDQGATNVAAPKPQVPSSAGPMVRDEMAKPIRRPTGVPGRMIEDRLSALRARDPRKAAEAARRLRGIQQ